MSCFSSARSSAASRFIGIMPFDVICHLASSSGLTLGDFQEFHVLRRPSTGDVRVATPGVWTKERRLVSEEHDPSACEVLRLSPGRSPGSTVTGTAAGIEDSKASSFRCQLCTMAVVKDAG